MPACRRWCWAPRKGSRCSTARSSRRRYALAGLFEAETLFGSALVTGALSTDAARGSDAPFDARIHALRRHRGQIEPRACAARLMAGSAIRASHLVGDERVQDPYCLRCQPQVMGAVPRPAAPGGARRSRPRPTASPTIRWSSPTTGEVLSGGNFHAEPVAFAADMLALAICEIGSLAERRIAMLVDPALSGLPAFLTPRPGLNSGFMIAQVTAAALASENKQLAHPASVDSIPTSANQEDHVSMAAHGARRLLDDGRQCRDDRRHRAAGRGAGLRLPRAAAVEPAARSACARWSARHVPHLDDDRAFAPDLARRRRRCVAPRRRSSTPIGARRCLPCAVDDGARHDHAPRQRPHHPRAARHRAARPRAG